MLWCPGMMRRGRMPGLFRGRRMMFSAVAMVGTDTMGHAGQLRPRQVDDGEEQGAQFEEAWTVVHTCRGLCWSMFAGS